MTRLDRADHGRSGRGLATLHVEGPGYDPSVPEDLESHPRRVPQPFPRPLSSNGLRAPDGPLVARHHVTPRPRRTVPQGGRFSRFAAAYGWRAFVIPVLALMTFVTLMDVASNAAPPTTTTLGQLTEEAPERTGEIPSDAPATAEGEGAGVVPPVEAPGSYVEQGSGTLTVVPGNSQVFGTGPLQRFVVEVEDGINVDPAAFAAAVEATLTDPRGWGAGGEMSFQRVDGEDYEFRVSLVSPLNVESFCPGVGTGGYTSCRYGDRAVINLARWETAVPEYEGDVETYRHYVVNHEVGHALGHGHEDCPGAGEVAPVMQQQTLGLDGCVRNGWPFP